MFKSQLANNRGKYATETLIVIAIIAIVSILAIPHVSEIFDPRKSFYGWDGRWKLFAVIVVTLLWVLAVVIASIYDNLRR